MFVTEPIDVTDGRRDLIKVGFLSNLVVRHKKVTNGLEETVFSIPGLHLSKDENTWGAPYFSHEDLKKFLSIEDVIQTFNNIGI